MANAIRRTVVVLALASNALAAAYYLWLAVADGVLTPRSFSGEAVPFAALYFGRAITPWLAVIALASSARRSAKA